MFGKRASMRFYTRQHRHYCGADPARGVQAAALDCADTEVVVRGAARITRAAPVQMTTTRFVPAMALVIARGWVYSRAARSAHRGAQDVTTTYWGSGAKWIALCYVQYKIPDPPDSLFATRLDAAGRSRVT